jgi:hypothetical protein
MNRRSILKTTLAALSGGVAGQAGLGASGPLMCVAPPAMGVFTFNVIQCILKPGEPLIDPPEAFDPELHMVWCRESRSEVGSLHQRIYAPKWCPALADNYFERHNPFDLGRIVGMNEVTWSPVKP